MEVVKVFSKDCKNFILNNHYAKRLPNIMKSYGLYR